MLILLNGISIFSFSFMSALSSFHKWTMHPLTTYSLIYVSAMKNELIGLNSVPPECMLLNNDLQLNSLKSIYCWKRTS